MNTSLRFARYGIAMISAVAAPANAQEDSPQNDRCSVGLIGGTLGIGPQVALARTA